MKAIFIGNTRVREIQLPDFNREDVFLRLMNEYKIMESHVIYFSAGESKIKEILILKEPTISAK